MKLTVRKEKKTFTTNAPLVGVVTGAVYPHMAGIPAGIILRCDDESTVVLSSEEIEYLIFKLKHETGYLEQGL